MTQSQNGQIAAEYVVLLSALCLSLIIASFIVEDGSNIIERFLTAIKSRTLILMTILRLPL